MRLSGQLFVGACVAVLLAGCNLSDVSVSRQSGEPCAVPGSRADGLVCGTSGVWAREQTPDMSALDQGADLTPDAADAQMEDLSCVGETDEELCALLGRCALEMSVVDRCNRPRGVACDETCEVGVCNTAARVCEGACMPKMCPIDVLCARVSNGCGATQVCDTCPSGQRCDPDAEKCEPCATPDPAVVCADLCGVAEAIDACGDTIEVQCSACLAGRCQENRCVSLEVIASNLIDTGARFGASLALDGDSLIVGSPGVSGDGANGNAEIFERNGQMRGWAPVYDVRMSFNDAPDYNGYIMGASVAINAGLNLALIGKSLGVRKLPFAPTIATVSRVGNFWSSVSSLDGEGRDFGFKVVTSGSSVLISSPLDSGGRGRVKLFSFMTIMVDEYQYAGNKEGDLAGFGLDVNDTQLVYGAPGASLFGTCNVALFNPLASSWSDVSSVIRPHNPSMTSSSFCRAVALGPNMIAASLAGQSVNAMQRDVVQLFVSQDDGKTWDFFQEIVDPAMGLSDGGFGTSISFALTDKLIIGDPLQAAASGVKEVGAVYVYAPDSSGRYVLEQEIRSSNPEELGHFGEAISTFEEEVLIGAPDEDYRDVDDSGVVYDVEDSGVVYGFSLD